MNSEGEKSGENLDDVTGSIEGIYCKEVTPILIKNASDHAKFIKITEELEFERLSREHAEMDARLTKLSQRIALKEKEVQELNHEIYNVNQIRKQTKVRSEMTGEIINILKDESEKLKNHRSAIEQRTLQITEKVDKVIKDRDENVRIKKEIEMLENQIKAILDSPELQIDTKIIQENDYLKQQILVKKEKIKEKQIVKCNNKKIKMDNLDLLKKITNKQDEVHNMKQKLIESKQQFANAQKELETKFNTIKEEINALSIKKEKYCQEIDALVKNHDENAIKHAEHKSKVNEKEAELKKIREIIEEKKEQLKQENEEKEKEKEESKEQLEQAKNKAQNALDENTKLKKVLYEKNESLSALQTQKGELVGKISDKKIECLTQQHQNAEKRNKNQAIVEQLNVEKQLVEELRKKIKDLDARIVKIQKEKGHLVTDLEEKKSKTVLAHKEQKEALEKQKKFHEATIEFAQDRLDRNQKQVDDLKKEIQDLENSKKYKELEDDTARKLIEGLKQQLERAEAQYQKLLKENRLKATAGASATNKRDLKGNLKHKNPSQQSSHASEARVEVIENEDQQSTSGRRSPGILKKTPVKRPTTPTKRVTFEGLSSTESSTENSFTKSLEDAVKMIDMENFLEDQEISQISARSLKKVPMDF